LTHSCAALVTAAVCLGITPAAASPGAGHSAAHRASQPAATGEPPLIGATFTHTSLVGCDLNRTGIVLHYDRPGVRRLVRSQLAAMRAAGLQTIRILLWHMSDITGHDWGVLPSAGGTLVEPYRSNLIRFASDVRAAGFSVFTVQFSPQWTNNPVGEYGPTGLVADRWDPSKFEENWALVADVHKLVKAFGPAVTHFDFISEGAASRYFPGFIFERMQIYIATMWRRYVDAFGRDDATVSAIGKGSADGAADRLQNLLDALRSTGLGFPSFFEVHPDWTSPAAFDELLALDETLRANGLTTQPLVVGESSYENTAVAADIARFTRETSRPISEVFEFWQTRESGPCASAPYRADAYIAALTGTPVPPPTPSPLPLLPVPTLTASLSRSGAFSFRDSGGRPVETLDAGMYRVAIRDRSQTSGFRIAGPGFKLATAKRFTGTRIWTGDIGTRAPYGATFTYAATARPRTTKKFVVH
jgi:hypothetical protein